MVDKTKSYDYLEVEKSKDIKKSIGQGGNLFI